MENSQNTPGGDHHHHQQVQVQPAKPISQLDKLKLMIIRIGDERRELRDDHLQKLKTQFNSAFVMKDKNNRDALVDALLTCVKHMPHKVNLYSYLVAASAVENFEFGQDVTFKLVESLNESLIRDGDCFKSKNTMRILANLVQIGLITSESFCQLLLQLVEDYLKLSGAAEGTGSQTHSSDLILETILAALPQTQQKLQKEQSIDFGTVIETLKQMYKERERIRQPEHSETVSDLLVKTWEAIFQSQTKILISDRVLLSPSRQVMVDLAKAIQSIGRKISTLPQIFFAEFNESQFQYSFQNVIQIDFQSQRLRRYRSPIMLNQQTLTDRFESVLAIDQAMAILRTFADSQQMAAQNLVNFYLNEELADSVGDVILQTIFSLIVTNEKPFSDLTPLYYAVLLNTIVSMSRDHEKLKKLKQNVEEKFSKTIFSNIADFSFAQRERIINFLGAYISQSSGRDLGLSEPFLLKLTEGQITQQQKQALKDVFAVVCRFIFVQKAKKQLDQQFYQYLPQDIDPNSGTNLEEPEAQIIVDALMAKESPEKLLEYADQHSSAIFGKCILARTRKSLDHLKTTVERYRKVFDHFFIGPNQSVLIEQVIQVFDAEPEKCLKVIQKLAQISILSTEQIVNFCAKKLQEEPKYSLAVNMIREALNRESLNKWQVVTKYQQKPPVSQAAVDDSVGAQDLDDKMGDEKVKVMSLAEYEAEYNNKFAAEIDTFKKTLRILAQIGACDSLIIDLFIEVETPFISNDILMVLPDGELKAKLSTL